MPKSPFQRAADEGLEGSSVASKRGKRKPKPTSKRRAKRQKVKETYSKAREDAQLHDVIPTTPEGAVRDEVRHSVDVPMPHLIAAAIRKGWAVPDQLKPELVDELVQVVLNPDMPAKAKIAAFSALRQADRSQWEQDNPVEAGKAKGATSTVAVSVQSNMLAVQIMREALEKGDIGRGETGLPPPTEPSASSYSRFDGTVEVGAASTSDERDTCKSVADTE